MYRAVRVTRSTAASFESTIAHLLHHRTSITTLPPKNSCLAIHEEPARLLLVTETVWEGDSPGIMTCWSDGELVTNVVKSWPYVYSYGTLSNVQDIMFGRGTLMVRSCHMYKVL